MVDAQNTVNALRRGDPLQSTREAVRDLDETTLVARAREGDAGSFSELVRRYESKIFRLARHVTRNREDAEDVLQETFMKAYEHLYQLQGDSKFPGPCGLRLTRRS